MPALGTGSARVDRACRKGLLPAGSGGQRPGSDFNAVIASGQVGRRYGPGLEQ